MKKRNKALLTVACAVLLVVVSVMGTFAYLTDADQAVNTFTVGNVDIELDEAKVNQAGEPEGEERVKENSYKLIPGRTYVKDPTVTVKEGSESSYIRMLVTINKQDALDAIYRPVGGMNLADFFNGEDTAKWIPAGEVENNDNTRTYEFRYYTTVAAPANEETEGADDVKLEALFTSFTVPGAITKEQLATISGLNITIVAQAIQADGFATADAAWAEWTN